MTNALPIVAAGAIVAALSRGLVAIGWLSFNLWIGAEGLFQGAARVAPSINEWPTLMANLNLGEFIFFVGFLLVHLGAVLLAPAEKLRVILWIATPIQVWGRAICMYIYIYMM